MQCCVTTSKAEKEVCWARSHARRTDIEGKVETQSKTLKNTEWFIERLNDQHIPTKKYEDMEENISC